MLLVYLFASLTAIGWYQIDPEHAFWITISVLVATCPCALSLAIPTALTCAVAKLTKRGILIKQAHVLETLPQLTDIAFDKTGTLTQGRFTIERVEMVNSHYSEADALRLAAQLESFSEHPIANAFATYNDTVNPIENVTIEPGKGITAELNKQHLAIGKSGWFDTEKADAQATLCISINKLLRAFIFADSLREQRRKTNY